MSRRDRNGISIKADGVVDNVRCGVYHSGNNTLIGDSDEQYECQGCGTYHHADTVRRAQQRPGGEYGERGRGGVYS